MHEIRRLTVLGRYGYESIPTITQFVAEAARAAGLDENEVFHCQMAVDEACTNIIEHAYGGQGTGDIELTCLVEPGSCVIQIVDHGKPFDPDRVPKPKLEAKLDEIKPGGIGLHLMRRLMDEVHFEFTDQGNFLTMKKSSSSQALPMQPQGVPVREAQQGIWIVRPHDRLDASSAPHLEAALVELLKQAHIWLVVDMAEVSYISSRGLKALVSAWRRAGDEGGRLVMCAMVPRVLSIFDTVGFTQIFDIYPSLDAALATLKNEKASKG
jgi:anti-anti-sigma factor